MNNPNADYSTLLDKRKEVFYTIYESAMTKLANEHEFPAALQEQLRAKRNFGLIKYGERAFQASIENAVASPVAAHLGDEIVDAFNYALHGGYIANMMMDDVLCASYEKMVDSLLNVLSALREVRNNLPNADEKEALKWTE